MIKLRTPAILLAAALALTACKSKAPVEAPGTASTPAPVAAPNPDAGSITGIVHFTGKPPARVAIDMSMDPACAMTAAENDAEQIVSTKGGLANVYIYIKSGAPSSNAPAGTAPTVLDQKGCRYTPHVIALQQGASVEFRNSDPTMHNIHTTPTIGNEATIDVSQGPLGKPQVHQFTRPEVMLPVRCNNHPWMNAFINVSSTPFFAVSSADGTFTITGLPPGNYTLAAKHEKLGEQETQISISPKSTAKTTFTFAQ